MITPTLLGDSVDDYYSVHAGAGDDTVVADPGFEAYGEDGDDVLTVTDAYGGVTDGGAGDDVLNVTPISSVVLGGEGNDTINYDDTHRGWEEGNRIDAGNGDDVINAHMEVGISASGAPVSTGDGADEVNLTIAADNVEIDTESGNGYVFDGNQEILLVSDFDAQNDILTIDPTTHNGETATLNGQAAQLTYTGYEVTEDDNGTTVILSYDAVSASETQEMTLNVRLSGATGVPADAIRVITG